MKIKDLFEKNKGKIIEEYHKGVQHNFNTYEEYEKYLNDYFGDKVVNCVLNESIENRALGVYSLEFDIRDAKGRIFNYEEFLWVVNEFRFYEEDRNIIASDDECSRCHYQVNCCGQCGCNYEN